MLSALWDGTVGGLFSNEDTVEQKQGQEGRQFNQQQERGQAPGEAGGAEVQQPGTVQTEALRAIWDEGPELQGGSSTGGGSSTATTATAPPGTGQAWEGSGSQTRQSSSGRTAFDYEDPEERQERRIAEAKDNFAKAKLLQSRIETIGEAQQYCEALVQKQLERAEEQKPEMNAPIYGDMQARKAIATLLPDEMIRELFLRTTKKKEAWPRLRSFFGVPPYNFLRPEDAGMVRAAGIASGRVNMTYERAGETAAYSQFGTGHLVDSYLREYRIVPVVAVSVNDNLPCDIESVGPSSHVYMNVRVPKRSREEKIILLKDATKRRAVVFPQVGEELAVQYSDALRQVWGTKANNRNITRVVVKSMVPRSATGSTAAVVAVKV